MIHQKQVLGLSHVFRLGMLRKMDGECLLAALSPKHKMKSKDSKKVSIILANDLNKDWVGRGHGPMGCQLWIYIV